MGVQIHSAKGQYIAVEVDEFRDRTIQILDPELGMIEVKLDPKEVEHLVFMLGWRR